MKKLLLIPVLLMFMGCMTDTMLKAELGYYEAMVAMQTQKATQPIFELTPAKQGEPIVLGNVGSFKVYAPPVAGEKLSQYAHKDYVQPWLNVLSMAVPWLGGWGIVNSTANAMKEMGASTHMTITGEGNTATIAGPVNNSLSGTGHVAGGIVDQTHTPTIVTQPAPVIVNPVIVTQPAPIIVTP